MDRMHKGDGTGQDRRDRERSDRVTRAVQRRKDALASRRDLQRRTVDDLDCVVGAEPVQRQAFDDAVQRLHDGVAVGNHAVYGDSLPPHLAQGGERETSAPVQAKVKVKPADPQPTGVDGGRSPEPSNALKVGGAASLGPVELGVEVKVADLAKVKAMSASVGRGAFTLTATKQKSSEGEGEGMVTLGLDVAKLLPGSSAATRPVDDESSAASSNEEVLSKRIGQRDDLLNARAELAANLSELSHELVEAGGVPADVERAIAAGRDSGLARLDEEIAKVEGSIAFLQRQIAHEARMDSQPDFVKAALNPLPPVRRQSLQRESGDDSAGPSSDQVHAAAATGLEAGASSLPHLDTIQRAFGRHDVSGVTAHTGAKADEATEAMGATAYATGDDVVLGGSGQSLHTVAHEAAHVVQQRTGVQLEGDVGEVGDRYEQHADAVADKVVAGESAEALLDEFAGSADGGAAGVQQVQREPAPSEETKTSQDNDVDETYLEEVRQALATYRGQLYRLAGQIWARSISIGEAEVPPSGAGQVVKVGVTKYEWGPKGPHAVRAFSLKALLSSETPLSLVQFHAIETELRMMLTNQQEAERILAHARESALLNAQIGLNILQAAKIAGQIAGNLIGGIATPVLAGAMSGAQSTGELLVKDGNVTPKDVTEAVFKVGGAAAYALLGAKLGPTSPNFGLFRQSLLNITIGSSLGALNVITDDAVIAALNGTSADTQARAVMQAAKDASLVEVLTAVFKPVIVR